MTARTTVVVPDLGDFHDVEVIEVLVKSGDVVAVDTPLITLETDKATMDVPSTAAGQVAEVSVKKGDRVSRGSEIVVLQSAGAEAPAKTATPAKSAGAAAPAKAATSPAAPKPAGDVATLEVRVPDLGDFKDVEVIEVLVKEGDVVALESPLVTLETEKATMDVPSSAAGIAAKLHVRKSSRVNAGDLVATVRGSKAAAAEPPARPAAQAAAHNPEATVRMTVSALSPASAAPLPDVCEVDCAEACA